MFPCLRRATLLSFHLLTLQPTLSAAYSWVLTAPPTQCSNLSINITGSDGVPPYRVLVVPFGATPFQGNKEFRSVIDHPFDGNSATTSFAINYPENSQFIAVVSDAHGFGTGGTSVAMQISNSGDSSCFNVSNPYTTPFYYNVGSDNQFTQCESTRIWWNQSTAQGTPNFVGIIPGGQSFTIPEPNITNTSSEETGFSWTPSIQAGTTLVVVAGDNRGLGAGGWATFGVGNNEDNSCLSSLSPSSTRGTPAGTYPTSTATSSSGSNSGRGTKTTALIGGVVGGIAGGLLLVLAAGTLIYFLRRNNTKTKQAPSRDHVLSQYNPEPFVAMRPTTSESTKRGSGYASSPTPLLSLTQSRGVSSRSGSGGYYRPSETSGSGSGLYRSSEFGSRNPLSEVPDSSQREPWNVDVIQHEDSGVSLLPPAEHRVVELPPRYDNIGTQGRPSLEVLLQTPGVEDPL